MIGNATGDLLIAAAMLYYVIIWALHLNGSPGADFGLENRQLAKRRRAADSAFNDHALVRIVRLTIETNVLTSKYTLM